MRGPASCVRGTPSCRIFEATHTTEESRRLSVFVMVVPLILVSCASQTRLEQRFELGAKSQDDLGKDRYECTQRHGGMSNFIACEARGYRHVKTP